MRDAPAAAFEVFVAFLRLGLTSFGGPVAHLAHFREAFVTRRRWLDDAAYADLVALCQFLPGPSSSQVGFAIGLGRAGWLGGVAAWIGFTAPSAALMLAAASGLSFFATTQGEAVAHGLKLVAVSVVAHAVYGMARSLCRTALTCALALAALVAMLLLSAPWMQPLVIFAGGLIASAWGRAADDGAEAGRPLAERTRKQTGVLLLLTFFALLVGLPLLARLGGGFALADSFYRAGALVFGGGHVVLPLLEAETVGRGWLGSDTFLSGYGAAQALPGPLFSFAAFLGAAGGPMAGWPGGLVALAAVFLPGLLLVAAVLPWRETLTRLPRARNFVSGANAAVVGLLAAALWDPVIASGVKTPADAFIAVSGFALLQWMKTPAWAVVLLVGGAGALAAG